MTHCLVPYPFPEGLQDILLMLFLQLLQEPLLEMGNLLHRNILQ